MVWFMVWTELVRISSIISRWVVLAVVRESLVGMEVVRTTHEARIAKRTWKIVIGCMFGVRLPVINGASILPERMTCW